MSTMHSPADSPAPTLAGLIRSHAETIANLRDNNITDTTFATYLAQQPHCKWTVVQIVREIQRQRARTRPRTLSAEQKSAIESILGGAKSTNGHTNGATTHIEPPPGPAAPAPAASAPVPAPAPAAATRSSIVPASSRESHLD